METSTTSQLSPGATAGDPTMPKPKKRHQIENQILERQVMICKAFANSTRLRMLDLLGQRDWPSAELQSELGVSKANLSQHVLILKSAGVILRRREGREVIFSLAMPEVKRACQLIQHVLRAQIRNGQKLGI
jgi:ArsR family transcriptional regulator, arsenate/arsenite/antimonite-responsive transcriptional repressor